LQDLSFFNGVPYVVVLDHHGIFSGTPGYPSTLNTSIYTDNLSWARGSTNFKFGVDIFASSGILARQGSAPAKQYGNFNFSNQGNGIGDFTGVDFATFW